MREEPGTATVHRKALAFLLLLFLFMFYKQTVWDPYHGAKSEAVKSQKEEQAAASLAPEAPVENEEALLEGTSPEKVEAASDAALAAVPSDSQVAEAGFVRVRTNTFDAKISLLGGRLTELRLIGYRETLEGANTAWLNLVEHIEGSAYPLGVRAGSVDDTRVLYRHETSADEITVLQGSQPKSLRFQGTLADGRSIEKVFRFYPRGNFVDIDVVLSAADESEQPVEIEWVKRMGEDEASMLDPYNRVGYAWYDGRKATHNAFPDFIEDFVQLDEKGQPKPSIDYTIDAPIAWISMQDKYFTKTLVAAGPDAESSTGAEAQHGAPEIFTRGRAVYDGKVFRALLAGGSTEGSFRLFGGPKSYPMLQEQGYHLQKTIDFGWTGFVAEPLMRLLHIFYGFLGNYGLAIVLLTILVKAALYPLTSASFKQMKSMQDIQPEVKKLRETVKDKQEQQRQLMDLYKKRGVNPLGGCFPMLLQMPIFIGLYSGLMMSVELRHAPFIFWIQDLSAPEKLMIGGIGLPIMVILFVVSMMIQQWTTPNPSGDPTQKKMMMIMPVVFGFMFMNFPAGLTLYWLTNNLISIAQQNALRRELDAKGQLRVSALASVGVFVLAVLLVGLSSI